MGAVALARSLGIDTRAAYQNLSAASLRAALKEQGLEGLVGKLRRIVPDISDQYTTRTDPVEFTRYWEVKTRGLHAFQVQAMLDGVQAVGRTGLVLVDIGDSSGTHGAYLRALAKPGQVDRFIGVNLDQLAVDRIKSKGGEAILCRAEELTLAGIRPDLFLSFETLEHLFDPIRFLNKLARSGSAEWLLFTVPWARVSRFGGTHLRQSMPSARQRFSAEQVHVWELSPEDWGLLAHFSGWKPVWTRIYRQYPRFSLLRVAQPLWSRLDHEGFIGLLCRRDLGLADSYADW
jgi:hypothetical protein